MADNRPMRNRNSGVSRTIPGNSQGEYRIKTARGQEFQEDQAHDLPLHALTRTPRNVFANATRIYQPDPVSAAQQVAANPALAAKSGAMSSALLYGVQRKGSFTQLSFNYTIATQLVLPAASRLYLLIQNLDAAANLFLGFGFRPDGAAGIGLRILAGGNYEPIVVPQNDIFIAGSGVGIATILFAIG